MQKPVPKPAPKPVPKPAPKPVPKPKPKPAPKPKPSSGGGGGVGNVPPGSQTSLLWGQAGERWSPYSRVPDLSYSGYMGVLCRAPAQGAGGAWVVGDEGQEVGARERRRHQRAALQPADSSKLTFWRKCCASAAFKHTALPHLEAPLTPTPADVEPHSHPVSVPAALCALPCPAHPPTHPPTLSLLCQPTRRWCPPTPYGWT